MRHKKGNKKLSKPTDQRIALLRSLALALVTHEKIKTTDEFLVEKRDPLVFPPDFEKIPEPGTKEKIQTSEEERIKKILKANEQKNVSNSNSSSVEDSILNKIRK